MTDDVRDVRAALATLTTDADALPMLVDRGLRQGKRLRTRRRITAAAAALGCVAVVAGGVGLAGAPGLRHKPADGEFTNGRGETTRVVEGRRYAVVYRSTTVPTFTILAERGSSDPDPDGVCFAATGPYATSDPPMTWTCWSPPGSYPTNGGTITNLEDTIGSVPLGNGYSIAMDEVDGNVETVLFVPPGRGDVRYLPTVALPKKLEATWRFAFAAFPGSDKSRGTFVPIQPMECSASARASRGHEMQVPVTDAPVRSTPEAALAAVVGAATNAGPGLPPKSGYGRVHEDTSKVVFGHEDGYEVDVLKITDTAWITRWIGRCT